jgi:glycosyltransferase involved in cell wall biosynthesis
MSARRVRLTVVMTHPVQYYAPWFRYIAERGLDLDLTVLYAIAPTPEQQGVGFGGDLTWDVPLTEGYRCRVIGAAQGADVLRRDRFRGVDVPEIGRAIDDSRPDVVLVPGWHSITLLRATWHCFLRRVPVLYRGDSHLGTAPAGWRRLPWAARTWLLLRLYSGYLSVGRHALLYLRRFGVPPSRIFVSPHAVDNDFFASSASRHREAAARAAARASWGLGPSDFVVLFVGKLEAEKRLGDVIHAMAKLAPWASLLVVGSGESAGSWQSLAVRLGVRAGWAGFLNQSELGRAYAAADCLALPSERESWGLVVNEALATGLPCVVSDRVGCAPDLIGRGETGDIYPMGDVVALASALARVRGLGERGHDWTTACAARAAEHSFERATAGLREACLAVTASRDVRPAVAKGIS